MTIRFGSEGYLMNYPRTVEQLRELFPIGMRVYHRTKGFGIIAEYLNDRRDVIAIDFGNPENYYADTTYLKRTITEKGNEY